MRALAYGAPAGLRLDIGRPVPSPAPGEALIRPTLAGVCATDLEIAKGYMGFSGVLGHEFVGVVEKAPGAERWEGKRVTGEINIPCRSCPMCAKGLGNHCPSRSVLGIVKKDGVFADFFTLPVSNLHEVPANTPDRAAVFTEPLAAAYRILEQVRIAPGMDVAVLGVGRLGQLAVRAMAAEGLKVTAIGRSRGKLFLFRGLPGVTATLDGDVAGRALYDVVVEATGSPEGFNRAMDLVRPCGTIVQKTTVASPAPVDLNRLVIDEITVTGSRCGPFPQALAALAAGKVDPAPLISDVVPLDRAEEAMAAAALPGAVKILIKIS